jgi:hypothetical protein
MKRLLKHEISIKRRSYDGNHELWPIKIEGSLSGFLPLTLGFTKSTCDSFVLITTLQMRALSKILFMKVNERSTLFIAQEVHSLIIQEKSQMR